MPLIQPQIAGPLSELSDSVLVTVQLVGVAVAVGSVLAHQMAPGLPNGPDTPRVPDRLAVAQGRALPPPVIQHPLRGCDRAVHLTGVIDGARITLRRQSGATVTAGFDCGDAWLALSH